MFWQDPIEIQPQPMYRVEPATRDPALRKAALDLLLALAEHGRVYSSTSNNLQAAMDALMEELAK